MKITKLETIWFDPLPVEQWERERGTSRQALPNNLWVQIHTDEGLIGLGETYYSPRAVSAIVHDVHAALLIGRELLDIDNHWNNMFSLVNFCGHAGAEMRAISAIDVALWDIMGKKANLPLYKLLGGYRDKVRAYASIGYYQVSKDLDKLASEALGCVKRGFTAVKFKIGRNTFGAVGASEPSVFERSDLCVGDEDVERVAAMSTSARKRTGRCDEGADGSRDALAVPAGPRHRTVGRRRRPLGSDPP